MKPADDGQIVAAARRRAWRFGLWAEHLCVWHLRIRGYGIVARRHVSPVGEIDIVARRGHFVAVIEVKARSDPSIAAAALGSRQRRRIERAAEAFLARLPGAQGHDVRFDVMLVQPWRLPRHIEDAWRPGD